MKPEREQSSPEPVSSTRAGFHRFLQLFRHNGFCCRWLCLICLLTGCTTIAPKLNRPVFPESYRIGSIDPATVIRTSPSLFVVRLNGEDSINRRLITLWKSGALMEPYRRIHPLLPLYQEDINDLSDFIQEIFDIYLVAVDTPPSISSRQLAQQMMDRLTCKPLTNIEVRFLMNGNPSTPFSKKPLTMLLISMHELALQSGANPVYPSVFSPYLREQQQLPPVRNFEEINLFATKKENRVYSSTMSGFIICRRKPENHQSKPTGPQ